MDYKNLDTLTDKELIDSYDIHMSSVFELEQELRNFSKREAELVQKTMQANKRFNKMLVLAKITEAQLVEKIRVEAMERGTPIASSALGEIRKSMVAKNREWQEVQASLNKARADAELWSGLLSAWQGRGYRLQELAKIAERSLWNEPVVRERGYSRGELKSMGTFRQKMTTESKIEDKLKGGENLDLGY
jgi:hypothetical protein